MPSNLPKIVARTDQETIDKFKFIAKNEERTVSQQMIYLVKEAIKQYEAEKGEIPIEKPD